MIRYFAPEVIDLDGHVHTMAVAEQEYPGGKINIYPCTVELHSTIYLGRRIRLRLNDRGVLTAAVG